MKRRSAMPCPRVSGARSNVRTWTTTRRSRKTRLHFMVAEALEPVRAAMSGRVRNGKLSVTDGPYAETKEQCGGFFLIGARDLNDAIRVASKSRQHARAASRCVRFATAGRSYPRRLHREESPMSPSCLTTMALIAAGTTSIGGLIALAIKQLGARSGTKNTPKQSPSQET